MRIVNSAILKSLLFIINMTADQPNLKYFYSCCELSNTGILLQIKCGLVGVLAITSYYLKLIIKVIMSLGGKLYIDPKNGKISLARTLKTCANCQFYANEVQQLKEKLFGMSQEISYHQKREQQMEILCEQIQKTKARLEQKLSLRKKHLSQTLGSSAQFDTNAVNRNILQSSKGFTDRLRPISMHSLDPAKYKELSTDRSWNL